MPLEDPASSRSSVSRVPAVFAVRQAILIQAKGELSFCTGWTLGTRRDASRIRGREDAGGEMTAVDCKETQLLRFVCTVSFIGLLFRRAVGISGQSRWLSVSFVLWFTYVDSVFQGIVTCVSV